MCDQKIVQILRRNHAGDWSPVKKRDHYVLTEMFGFSVKCLCLLLFGLQGSSKILFKRHLSFVVVSRTQKY